MIYRAVGNLVAVDFSEIGKFMPSEKALEILEKKGFEVLIFDWFKIARNFIGNNIVYRRNARMREAPMVVNCSTFVKWLYSLKGIWIPRYALQQRKAARFWNEFRPGDLVFKSGLHPFYCQDLEEGVGHVGFYTEKGTVIHATDKFPALEEVSLKDFIGKNREFRGIKTIIENPHKTLTLRIPASCEIETSDDINFILWGNLQ